MKHKNDGYKDGFNGRRASPPPPYSFSGSITTAFAKEYLDGWMLGRQAKREHDEKQRIFAAKGGNLNHF